MTASQDKTSFFNETYDATNRMVLALITAKCGSTEDISDIFQETYMAFYQSVERKGTTYPKDARRLLMKIAKCKLAEYYKRKARQPAISSLSNEDQAEEAMPLDLEADTFLTEDIAVNAAIMEEAKEYLLQKTPDVRKIFYLFYHLDLPIPDIAEQMTLSESNVKNKLYRTVNELKALFHAERMG